MIVITERRELKDEGEPVFLVSAEFSDWTECTDTHNPCVLFIINTNDPAVKLAPQSEATATGALMLL